MPRRINWKPLPFTRLRLVLVGGPKPLSFLVLCGRADNGRVANHRLARCLLDEPAEPVHAQAGALRGLQ